MKVTMIAIVIGALSTVTKGLIQGLEELEIRGRVGTIQTTALLRTARIVRRLAVTQTPVKNHLLMLKWKSLQRVSKVKLSPFSRGWSEGSLFKSYYNEV